MEHNSKTAKLTLKKIKIKQRYPNKTNRQISLSRKSEQMYLRRQISSRNYNRAANDHSDRSRRTREEARITASTASRQSLFLLLLPSPSVVDKSLITVVDNGINSGSYLYDLFRTNVGGRRSATETTQKLYNFTSNRNSLNVSVLSEKRLRHEWV